MSSVPDLPPRFFEGPDGARLAWRELGEGRPVVLLHGLFSNAATNWVRYGHARAVADQGLRVVMPDLRGHGDSAAPRDAGAYPPDVLAADGEALIDHLGLTDYDLGGYSLGGRTALRMMVRGSRPRRAVLAGMGLEGIVDTAGRGGFFRDVLAGIGTHRKFSPEWMAEAFLRTTGGDPAALVHVLGTFVDTRPEELAEIPVETLVACGEDDRDNGSPESLAGALPQGRYVAVPGNHMSAVTLPALGQAFAEFLGGE